MKVYFLPDEKLKELIKVLKGLGKVFWSREREITSTRESRTKIKIEELEEDAIQDYRIPGFRSYDSFRTFLLPLRSKVAEYPDDEWIDIKNIKQKTVLLGLKACDLCAFSLLDKVFIEDPEFIDPFYKRRRQTLILITSDCTRAGKSCFCNLLGRTPYVTSNFDLNLSEIKDGYLIESGSEIGENILKNLSPVESNEEQIQERDKNRKNVMEELTAQNADFVEAFSNPDILVSEGYKSEEGWNLGRTCVSCGACTNVCPVCYCFTLFDRSQGEGKKSKRFRVWDSCQFKGFSQMAGGLNPRFPLMEQFKNRYYHKFFRFHERYNEYKCTGCGRCIDNCLGDIDMREVLSGIKIEREKVNG
ncbi:MAG: 4Fe-4S dicluster domain-containing protein [candidate division WOR-3 bacterium]|nr:4Fe-4S dicluster domain-containing protein [candidate division WOR-3 bacterium]